MLSIFLSKTKVSICLINKQVCPMWPYINCKVILRNGSHFSSGTGVGQDWKNQASPWATVEKEYINIRLVNRSEEAISLSSFKSTSNPVPCICGLKNLSALCDEDDGSHGHKPFLLQSVIPALTRPFIWYTCLGGGSALWESPAIRRCRSLKSGVFPV